MNTYKITIVVEDEERTSLWSGYTEQVAIAQAFLYHAQSGARALKVLGINKI